MSFTTSLVPQLGNSGKKKTTENQTTSFSKTEDKNGNKNSLSLTLG